MSVQSAISRALFAPRGERLLLAVQVWRRQRKTMSFLPVGARDYSTFICVSVTDAEPRQLLITKVRRSGGSSPFARRCQWTVEQLRKVNGINPNKDTPEFDLVFDNSVDQWVTGSSAEKCMFVQILYNACQNFWMRNRSSETVRPGQQRRASQPTAPGKSPAQSSPRSNQPPKKTEFTNCQPKLTGDASAVNLLIYRFKAFLNRTKNMMATNQSPSRKPGGWGCGGAAAALGGLVQTPQQRGGGPSRAEDGSRRLPLGARRLADAVHTLALKRSK